MTVDERSCWKEGTITREMLEREEFSSCFVRNVFNAEHALKFFQSLHIVARIDKSKVNFIMPCILQAASDREIENHLPQCDENVDVLVVHFPSGIPNGIFCATHNGMRSKYRWTTFYEENESGVSVACLYRNMVKLQHPDEAVTITFVHGSSLRHFEVHVETKDKDLLPDICPEILRNIFDSIRIVESTFDYEESGATPAFLCPCGKKDRHAAILNESHTSLKCTHTSKVLGRRSLKGGHTVWLKG